MNDRITPKLFVKKALKPFVGPTLRLMHIKILGKHPFINRYTRKLPIISRLIKIIEWRTRLAASHEIRYQEYQKWFKRHYPPAKELARQRQAQDKLSQRPVISLLVPTYNTNINHLRECIESVLAQSYDNWQLCLADDKSSDPAVRELIVEYAQKDKRIRYVFRKSNGHICEASNSALELAQGRYVALLDHDDVLWPNALFEVVSLINKHPDAKFLYSDEDKIDEHGKKHLEPFFKPDWSPEFLRSINYITHFAVLDKQLVQKVGGFRKGYEGAQDWDLFLRVSRELDHVYHVPTVLYSWRKSATSTAQAPSAKDYAYINQKKALEDDIKIRGLKGELSWQIPFSMWRIDYESLSNSLVSIIIPTKDQYDFIKRCLDSVRDRTNYKNFELIIVDTGSTDSRVWDLYDEYKKQYKATRIIKWTGPFNFAGACDLGAKHAKGEYLLFLNNDTEVISETWIEDMMGYAQQKDIGAVGCKLYYPDKKLQHAGIILGVGGQNGTPGIAGHFFPAYTDEPPQDAAQQLYVGGTRNFTAVTAACVMVSKQKFDAVKGFDPVFKIAFNDVDLCLKLYEKNWRNVYLPHVTLYHHESISVGQPGSKQRNLEVFAREINLMLDKWGPLIKDDPYYHPEFRRDIASARLKV